jgi:hypothetical protein
VIDSSSRCGFLDCMGSPEYQPYFGRSAGAENPSGWKASVWAGLDLRPSRPRLESGTELGPDLEQPERVSKSFGMMVARDGIEPPTPAFSGLRSTTELPGHVSIEPPQAYEGIGFALIVAG